MVKVIATSKGYFGGQIQEVGNAFVVPDDLWNDPKRRPSWAILARPGTAPAPETEPSNPAGHGGDAVTVPTDWRSGSAADRKALAKAISGESFGTAKEADAVIQAYVDASGPELFGDAPAPEVLQPVRVSNEIQDALGGPAPDWLAPASGVIGSQPTMTEE